MDKVKKTEDKTFQVLLKEHPLESTVLKRGDIVNGVVVKIVNGTVFVDINYKSEGFISGSELKSADYSIKNIIPGSELTVYVLNPENEKGQTELSLRRTEDIRRWQKLNDSLKNNDIMQVKVVDFNAGGLLVDISGGLSGFVPISQLDFARISKNSDDKTDVSTQLSSMIGEELNVKVIELDRAKDRIIFSEKLAVNNENITLRNETLKNIKVNDILDGVVTGVTKYGLFVTAQGLEGLVHLSEISWDKVSDPADFYKVGDEVKVQVIGLGDEGKRIAYSIKRLQNDVWDDAISKYKVGQIIKGTVQKIVDYGVFIKIEEGINGLIHITELSDTHFNDINDIVKVGDELNLKVLSISPVERHLGLSLKKVESDSKVASTTKKVVKKDKKSVADKKIKEPEKKVVKKVKKPVADKKVKEVKKKAEKKKK
ncbi:S1 RNA-binding domain-containing protein [Patescibacteria group bacterium]|nr:S1 RNA-binding domain-containing protein [Patescibacteria group bacterium]